MQEFRNFLTGQARDGGRPEQEELPRGSQSPEMDVPELSPLPLRRRSRVLRGQTLRRCFPLRLGFFICHFQFATALLNMYTIVFRAGMQASSVQGSVLGSSRMDHSFVVLPRQKIQGPGIPRPRAGNPQSDGNNPSKTMEESFVLVPHAAASMYKNDSATEGGGVHSLAHGEGKSGPFQPNNAGFHSSLAILKRAFDIVTSQLQVTSV